jgi:pimeloyl-ACP methyl ester carboxylesterase
MSQAPREVALASMEALHKWRSEQLVEAVGKVTVPIVAINSDMRPSDVQSFESTFSSFKFVIMSGVGHFAMLEDPKTFNRLLAETINELSR